jgi:virginiamycin B lyase
MILSAKRFARRRVMPPGSASAREVAMRSFASVTLVLALLAAAPLSAQTVSVYPVVKGSGPHDVWPLADGRVWYTGQSNGTLGLLDPATGKVAEVKLGEGSAPHGVIVGPDGAAWVTDGGQNAIVRVDPGTKAVKVFKLPEGRGDTNLNTPVFDKSGTLWFTGQSGVYGRLDPQSGAIKVWDAPRGRGAYGIAATPDGAVYYASLAGSHIARIDTASGEATPIDPPTKGQGARRIWSDSKGRLWVSEWNSGQVSVFDPTAKTWKSWKLPGDRPRTYAVYVDETDKVWLTDFTANAIVRFDPATEKFQSFPSDKAGANVRQLAGRPGETWGAESGTDRLVVVRFGTKTQ